MRQGGTILTVNGSQVAVLHTLLALGAFGTALVLGCYLHYQKIVKNEWYGYPQEWFPSVSATIGDYYPERPIFQILIAFNSGPRLLLVYLNYVFQTRFSGKASTKASKFVALCGFLRTVSCGGWVYITSSDDHLWHDVMMISYIILTIPWQLGNVVLSPDGVLRTGNKYRRRFSASFFLSLIPLVYFFLQHKVKRVPGAYTYYAFVEWSLILYDVLYDSSTIIDFVHLDFVVNASPKSKAEIAGNLLGGEGKTPLGTSRTNPSERSRKIPTMSNLSRGPSLHEAMQFSAQVYFGFVFWTTLTAIGPVIFYFSVWSMGLDGQEVLLFATVAPFLLCSSLFRSFFRKTLPILQLASLLSIGSYLVDRDLFYDDAVLRLQLTTIGVGLCATLQTFHLFQSNLQGQLELEQSSMALGIGLVASVLLKYANYSLNPMWSIMRKNNGGFHRIGLILGILSSIYLRSNLKSEVKSEEEVSPPLSPVSKTSSRSSSPASSTCSASAIELPISPTLASHDPVWWRAVLGFGGIMFIIHTLFTDSGTMISWVWDGYPVTGPLPLQQGYWMILAMCTGLFLPLISEDDMLHHPRWLLLGYTSAFGLYSFHGWLGFASGLLLCIFCLSIFPRYLQELVLSSQSGGWWKVAVGFGFGYLIYDLLELCHTFTVAYAFVPFAAPFRERTDAVLFVTMALISLGYFQPRPSDSSSKLFLQNPKRDRSVKVMKIVLGFLALGSVMVMLRRTALKADIKPYHPENRTFKAGIWTVHFGVDSGMWESQRRIKDIVKELELDVIGLLETDLQRIVMGNRDLTQYVSEELGMFVDSGPGPNKHTWGAVLLSKFPILNSTHYLLPSPQGELAPAIHATLDVWGTHVDVIVSHNGQEEDPVDRTLQSIKLAEIMRAAYPKPFVFLGYVVSKPHAPRPAPYQILVEDGRMLDIERGDTDRWCEYILFRGLKRLGYARVTRGSTPAVTDTELQVGLFQVPPNWVLVDPDRDSSDYQRVPADFIALTSRFSAKVGSNEGFRGHQYHVLREQFGTDVVYYRM
ncbi:hypothetical protein Pst134EA_029500 [Puccinia striiformis f. sp. tritici]|uniref:hypothetical protein n=1 Tax=Puccinia striiformis f. sp. tritici TaxID=168172 RepID=UPI0020072AAA|nr:hypothetical protein Pst134EA_029500 [Puccinia striiformis f. sp. tritici]KAH9441493.1 hypothetical protein Pst134EB_030159 [Puccinia striiformis f. sp. tritici]KAH9447464.1 hypothetical protein Pst134EA_029500 [Puccinia striiformis f. sp. tritici]